MYERPLEPKSKKLNHFYFSKARGYFEGIEGNVKLMPEFYPNWTMRVYFELRCSYDDLDLCYERDPLYKKLCQLTCKYQELDICYIRHLPGTPLKDSSKIFPPNWRFFPVLDPQVFALFR